MNRLFVLLSFLVSFSISAQTVKVSGRVTSESDPEGLPGVNIVIKGTNEGTITDLNGSYSLDSEANSVLVFSFIGYTSQEVAVNGQGRLNIIMVEEAQQLG